MASALRAEYKGQERLLEKLKTKNGVFDTGLKRGLLRSIVKTTKTFEKELFWPFGTLFVALNGWADAYLITPRK